MILTLFAAIGENNELGKENDLIWKIPEDQKRMRERTTGHTLIMGRKTFESLPHALPNRRHIVITRDPGYIAPGGEVVHSLDEALNSARAPLAENDEVFIFGGAEIFNQAIGRADRLDITLIHATDPSAQTFFPAIDPKIWHEKSREEHIGSSGSPSFAFITYEKN